MDSVSTEYSIPGLCSLVYSLELAADATAYIVTIVEGTPNQIQVATTNTALVGITITLTLLANATPLQDTPSSTCTFDVTPIDICSTATISFGA